MLGVVIRKDLKNAFLYAPGVSRGIFAAFSEVKNAQPKELDIAEIVSFTLVASDRENYHAKAVELLTGKREREALRTMQFHAEVSLRRVNNGHGGECARDKDYDPAAAARRKKMSTRRAAQKVSPPSRFAVFN